jgi:hypothetical protein
MMLARSLLIALALVAFPVAGEAQKNSPVGSRGTPEDQRACTPDARRLCREYVGDDMAVLACFKQQATKLSRACRAVLERHGQL